MLAFGPALMAQLELQRFEQQSDFEASSSKGGITAIGNGPWVLLMVPRRDRLVDMRLEISKSFGRAYGPPKHPCQYLALRRKPAFKFEIAQFSVGHRPTSSVMGARVTEHYAAQSPC